jgi:peptidyl-prolyl cis-trans isomerase B (cyclophilin B)
MKRQIAVLAAVVLSLSAAAAAFGANPQVTLNVTGGVTGTIVLELYQDQAPITVANFVGYVQSGFYNGLIFHRVYRTGITIIQSGGFDTNLNPRTPGATIINESYNRLSNVKYTVAMARTDTPDSASSQFYINQIDDTTLDGGAVAYDGYGNAYTKTGYCVFGHVISGMAVVDTIAGVATTTRNGMTDVPVTNIIISSATLNTSFCATKLAGDADGDCRVDMVDFALMASHWLQCNSINTICN